MPSMMNVGDTIPARKFHGARAEETVVVAGVLVRAAQRGEHLGDAGLAKRRGGLVVFARRVLPEAAVDSEAESADDPDDRGAARAGPHRGDVGDVASERRFV